MRKSFKRTAAFVLALTILSGGMPLRNYNSGLFSKRTIVADAALDGKGTEANPYKITTATEFAEISSNLSANYILLNDITITSSISGTFSGVFDGKGHTITLDISSGGTGVFDIMSGTVKNLGVTGAVTGDGKNVGGITGQCHGTIQNCWNSATVSGQWSGGISGNTAQSGSIINCYNTGTIYGSTNAGGIVGAHNKSISNCYNTGSVTGTAPGQIVGIAYNVTGATISNCYYKSSDSNPGIGQNNANLSQPTQLSADKFKDSTKFVGWDFTNTWKMGENGPDLRYFYTITFNSNGGTNVDSQTLEKGEYAAAPAADPTADGYTFGGWYDNAECTGDPHDFTQPMTGDVEVFAKWIGSITPAHVTYTPASGGASESYTVKIGDETLTEGTDYTITKGADNLVTVTGIGKYKDEIVGIVEDDIFFKQWTLTDSLPDSAENWYLVNDVAILSTWSVPSGTTNLNLNGHGIKMTGSGSVISVNSGITLNIYDSDTTAVHRFTVPDPTVNGAGLAIVDDSLTGTEGTNYQTFTGGYITGGNAANGGGISVNAGTLTINAGTIIGNNSSQYGGGVYGTGNCTINLHNNGAIRYNKAIGSYSCGGGAYLDNGTFNMSGGMIEKNQSAIGKYGNGVCGGGIYVAANGTFNASGGYIKDNRADPSGGGGGIALEGRSNAFLSGDLRIIGNYGGQGGGILAQGNLHITDNVEITDNTAPSMGGGIQLNGSANNGTMYLSGNPYIMGNTCIQLNNSGDPYGINVCVEKTFYIDGDLAETETPRMSIYMNLGSSGSNGWQGSPIGTIAFASEHINANTINYISSERPYMIALQQEESVNSIVSTGIQNTSAADVSYTYDKQPHSITVNADSDATVTYSTDGITYTSTKPTFTNCGEYTVYYKVSKTGYATVARSAVVNITKKSVTITPTANQSKVYGEVDPAFTYEATGLCTGDTLSGSLTRATGNNAGSYTFDVSGLTNSNYTVSLADGASQFTITKKALTVTANNKTITYGDAPANDGVEYDGFVTGESAINLGGTLVYDYSYTRYGDVGSNYTITPSGLTSNNYAITFVPSTLTVNQKEIEIVWSNTNLTYTGSELKPAATPSEDSLVNNDVIGIAVSGGQTIASANDYTATASGLTGDKAGNYKLPTNKTTTFTIGKAVSGAAAPQNNLSLTYNKTAQQLITAGTNTNGKWQYKLGSDGTYGDSVPTATDADTYTVYYKFVGDGNHEDIAEASFTVMIAKKTIGITWSNTSFTYDGGSHVPTATATELENGDTCNITVTGGQINASDTAYTATASGIDNSNYQLPTSGLTTNFTISASTNSFTTAPTLVSNPKYRGTAIQLITSAGVPKFGDATDGNYLDVKYLITTDETLLPTATQDGWLNYGDDGLKATAVGTYYVWYQIGAGTDWNAVAPTLLGTVNVTRYIPPSPSYYSQTWTMTMESYEYDGTAHTPVIDGKMYGDVTYTYYTADGTELNEAPSAVGSYKVVVYAEGGTNYYSRTQTAEYSITAKPAPTEYTVTVKNGTVNGATTASYAPDTVIVVKADKAPNGKKFAYWKKNGSTASYSASYTFPLSRDMELEAVYTSIADEFQTDGTGQLEGFNADKENGKLQIAVLHSVPNDCKILKAGLVATSDTSKLNNLTAANADYVKYYENITVHNFKYTWTKTQVTADQTWYVRSYLVYKDADGKIKVVYGDMVQATLDGYKVQVENKIVGASNMDNVKLDKENHKISFAALMSVPVDCTIKYAGVVATSDASKVSELTKIKVAEKAMVNGIYVRGMTSDKHTVKYTWTKTAVTEDQTWYVRSYLVYVDSHGQTQYVYGDLTTAKLN